MPNLTENDSLYWQERMIAIEAEQLEANKNFDIAAQASNEIRRKILTLKAEVSQLQIQSTDLSNKLRMARSNNQRLKLEYQSARNKFFSLQRAGA